jgi:hypothetical protein
MGGALVILLHGEGWHARWLAVSLALTAAASGDPVRLALFGPALRAWVEGRFDEGAPPEAPGARVGSLADMLEEGRRDLGLHLVACDTAVRLAGVEPALAASRLEITSLPVLWSEAREGRLLAL